MIGGNVKSGLAPISDETQLQVWSIWLMAAFTISWFFCLGACLGSFLNVIVWRWPRGRSVIRGCSACPECGTPILWQDNIPILGWLRLGGRCRACGVRISVRYPLVEALVGLQFVILLAAETLTGGATLPVRPIDIYAGVVWIIWYAMQPDLLRIYAWHLTLLYLANIIWLIDEDGQRIPRSLWLIVPVVGLVGGIWFPDLNPTLRLGGLHGQPFTWMQRSQGFLSGFLGWLSGTLIGYFVRPVPPSRRVSRVCAPTAILLASVGIVLGWQGAVSTALIAGIFGLLQRLIRDTGGTFGPRSTVFALWLALPVQLLAWRWLDSHWWWPGSRATWPVLAAATAMTLFLWRLAIRDERADLELKPFDAEGGHALALAVQSVAEDGRSSGDLDSSPRLESELLPDQSGLADDTREC